MQQSERKEAMEEFMYIISRTLVENGFRSVYGIFPSCRRNTIGQILVNSGNEKLNRDVACVVFNALGTCGITKRGVCDDAEVSAIQKSYNVDKPLLDARMTEKGTLVIVDNPDNIQNAINILKDRFGKVFGEALRLEEGLDLRCVREGCKPFHESGLGLDDSIFEKFILGYRMRSNER